LHHSQPPSAKKNYNSSGIHIKTLLSLADIHIASELQTDSGHTQSEISTKASIVVTTDVIPLLVLILSWGSPLELN
jgi:hypothetical protein